MPKAAVVVLLLVLSNGRAEPPVEALNQIVTVHGSDLKGSMAKALLEMKQELTAHGCGDVRVSLWTPEPHRLALEVRCVGWRWRTPLDPWAILRQ